MWQFPCMVVAQARSGYHSSLYLHPGTCVPFASNKVIYDGMEPFLSPQANALKDCTLPVCEEQPVK